MRRYKVQLTKEECIELHKLISSGVAPTRKLTRARILLKVAEDLTKTEISRALDVTNNTITNVCHTLQTQRLAAIERKKPDREYEHTLGGEAEAYSVAIACSTPPEGRERWTLRLLQPKMIKRMYVDEVSHETIRAALKKRIKPWLKEEWCIPPKADVAFVCQMENVLYVYKLLYDPKRQQICMDEMPK